MGLGKVDVGKRFLYHLLFLSQNTTQNKIYDGNVRKFRKHFFQDPPGEHAQDIIRTHQDRGM